MDQLIELYTYICKTIQERSLKSFATFRFDDGNTRYAVTVNIRENGIMSTYIYLYRVYYHTRHYLIYKSKIPSKKNLAFDFIDPSIFDEMNKKSNIKFTPIIRRNILQHVELKMNDPLPL